MPALSGLWVLFFLFLRSCSNGTVHSCLGLSFLYKWVLSSWSFSALHVLVSYCSGRCGSLLYLHTENTHVHHPELICTCSSCPCLSTYLGFKRPLPSATCDLLRFKAFYWGMRRHSAAQVVRDLLRT
ncbi:hypothetical protein QBC37DRAFT_113714 [Rhypophila decipiens]|uniref:Secreted protein n=1 Tax=Rhypophila decipiens TaxID=261697 RepID=A0AAN7B9N9_9PEZI|nr:hypothetical protein QBC37DRAFT_113714 [Rhypophila decipiens]